MPHEDIIYLSKLRLERADECLNAAKVLLSSNQIKSVPNRSYYAVFHAMRAVLAIDGIDMKHHSGLISEFRKRYIKTGIFEKSMSDTISTLFGSRTDGDYDDFYVISRQEAADNLSKAETFVVEIKNYLSSMYCSKN